MASGVICEYNPFHKGHLYHLEETRRLSGDPDIICIMSGNYTQRGEPAIADKWVRTQMALAAGADLIIELPTYYSASGAQSFAFGAVQLACHTHVIRRLSFGVEPGTKNLLCAAAGLLTSHHSEFERRLSLALTEEKSFPRAREIAISGLLSSAGYTPLPSLFSPNAILGLEYLLQLQRHNSFFETEMIPLMIERDHSDYRSLDPMVKFPSAAALRNLLSRNEDISSFLPAPVREIWQDALHQGLAPLFPSAFSPALHYALSYHTPESLRNIADVKAGLENRIQKAAVSYPDWDLLLRLLSNKSYPVARMRRILLNILLNITTQHRDAIGFEAAPPYLRILGFRREKEWLLKMLCRQATLPVITSLSHLPSLSPSSLQALQDEIRFTDIYFSALPSPSFRGRGYEYRAKMIVY